MATGWEQLEQMFIEAGMPELVDVIKNAIQSYGAESDALIYQDLRASDTYKKRFAGNFEREAQKKPMLSEAEYLYQEKMYEETMKSYQAGDLATRENFARFIANDVSVNELSQRFTAAYDRVQMAVNSNDKPLVDELRKMYPGITDSELAKTLLLGNEGSQYLKNKIDIAEVKAAETETGVKSNLGADFLVSQGINRQQARQGLSKVAEQTTGMGIAAQTYGAPESPEEIKTQLERENLLGQSGKGTRKLASQARAQMSTVSGTGQTSLKKPKTQV